MSTPHLNATGPALDTLKTQTEIEKMHAEIAKIMAETIKTNRENRWSPVAYASGFLAAGAALVTGGVALAKLFLH
ncbi:hypothetical protein [Burkholderia oklahomensis]|uniref:Uncharacterized protein n=1 Tax=Burkholderia oklahomensis TaxID=342113 RepID=A0AAI8BEA6_9BURK|nr:hypothetical protein [Burkholderia oklahomensis]AIO70661.1 hypothetical protein DM82_4376 [Burkholderia oklahomensis]AOI40082.1 hypothetical protein WG70_10990 [Burkholderia oklahomensis EO147]KUY68360.1 hypothetical protein WG70_25170 [Burkholderia oklahomensis EO147]QPS39546.1 hypothetical protein I6G57_27300 [Burkholderia oklahomensis]